MSDDPAKIMPPTRCDALSENSQVALSPSQPSMAVNADGPDSCQPLSLSEIPAAGTPFELAFANAELLPQPAVKEGAAQPPTAPSPFELAFASALNAAPLAFQGESPGKALRPELPTPPPVPELAAETSMAFEPSALRPELPTPPPLPPLATPIQLQAQVDSLPPPVPEPTAIAEQDSAAPLAGAPEITLRRPPSYPSREELTPLQAAACGLFRASFATLLGISADQPQGNSEILLRLDHKREAARFQAFLEGEAHPDQPDAIQGILALGNIYLATQLKPVRFPGRANVQRQKALERGLAHCAQLNALISGAATYEALGPQIHAAFFQVIEQLLDFLRFCWRAKLDPAMPESVARYLEAVRKRRFATSPGDRLEPV